MFENCDYLTIIFLPNWPHGLVFQDRKLCFFEALRYCFLCLVELANPESTKKRERLLLTSEPSVGT